MGLTETKTHYIQKTKSKSKGPAKKQNRFIKIIPRGSNLCWYFYFGKSWMPLGIKFLFT